MSNKPPMETTKDSTDRARDTGLALVLLLLLLARTYKQDLLILLAIATLVVSMLWPAVFRLPARLWFGLAELLGTVSSKILLTVVFALVLVPIATFRKLAGSDPMKRKLWRKNRDSVFLERNHTFSADDLKNPY